MQEFMTELRASEHQRGDIVEVHELYHLYSSRYSHSFELLLSLAQHNRMLSRTRLNESLGYVITTDIDWMEIDDRKL